jgi:hypothetical protein
MKRTFTRKHALAVALFVCTLLGTWWWVKHTQANHKPTPFDEVLTFVQNPQNGFDSMDFRLQIQARLVGAHYQLSYKYAEQDQEKWLKVLRNEKENIYARMCAAHYIADSSEEARKFLESQIESPNLRYRYNAAEAVRRFSGRNPEKKWGIDLLLKHISTGTLDGSGVRTSPSGSFPDGDRHDIIFSPLDDICWDLGYMKCARAVPVLIGVLERKPETYGAAFALGEIGDRTAIPALMNILTNRPEANGYEVMALGKLKAEKAVPIFISRLGTRKAGSVLEALLESDDKRAIAPIKSYLATNPDKSSAAIAKRVLAQLDSADPVAELITLLDAETDESERVDLMFALARYPADARVLERLSSIASISDSAFMRRESITALGEMDTSKSLLFLVSLMDQRFPDNLNARQGWKIPPKNFTEYFHQQIHKILTTKTGKDFPSKSASWKQFLETYRSPSNAEAGSASKP